MYPVTPTLSVEAVHVMSALVVVSLLELRFVGCVGACESTKAPVVKFVVPSPDSLPAASFAFTPTLYEVSGLRPVRLYEVLDVDPSNVPFTYTSYPVTATLSVDALHVMSALESVTLDAVTLVGSDGASVSVGSVVVQEVITISSK